MRHIRLIKQQWPFFVAALVLTILVIFTYRIVLQMTGGNFTYGLDDAYIHMVIAKNFALDGVWGVSNEAFTSSSSSPLWTLILAGGYAVAGPMHNLSFWINIVCSFALLFVVQRICRRCNLAPRISLLLLLSLIFCIPVMPLIFSGMEHVLQIVLVLLFVDVTTRVGNKLDDEVVGPPSWVLISLGILICAIRYESVFLVIAATILLIIQGRGRLALLLAALSVIPQAIMGIFNMEHGWPLVPVPILLKASKSAGVSLGEHVFMRAGAFVHDVPHFTVLVVLAAILFGIGLGQGRRVSDYEQRWLFIFFIAAMFHAAFARFGWFYRYEAYLMALGMVGCTLALRRTLAVFRLPSFERGAFAVVIVAIVLVPLAGNGLYATAITSRGCRDVYEQQRQMGLFLDRYYRGSRIAVNDIGATAWFSPNHLLFDTFGLASLDVAHVIESGQLNSTLLESMAQKRHVEVAVIYSDQEHMSGGVPPSWRWMGDWSIARKTTAGLERVYFFAVAPDSDEKLRASLRSFATGLPTTVSWHITEPGECYEPFPRRRSVSN